jgi:hypothetical protein
VFQEEHQTGTAFENKGHIHTDQSFQQSEGEERALQYRGIAFAVLL